MPPLRPVAAGLVLTGVAVCVPLLAQGPPAGAGDEAAIRGVVQKYVDAREARDPKAIEALNAAFLAICKSLRLDRGDATRRELVARKVIDIGRTGERDPQRIHNLVLLALKESDKRSA